MPTMAFYINGTKTLFANGYRRVVIGGQGAYIEFCLADIQINLEVLPSETWRGKGKYSNCKYLWLYPDGYPDVKVYEQEGTVSYADYKVGLLYVDPRSLSWCGSPLLAEQNSKPGKGLSTVYYPTHRM